MKLNLQRFIGRFLPGRSEYNGQQLKQVVPDMRLVEATSRLQESRDRAQADRSWIRGGFDALVEVRTLAEARRLLTSNRVSNAALTERALGEDGLPAALVAPIRHRLDEAAALLARPFPDGRADDTAFRDASSFIQAA